ncbi:CoA transferase [Pseudonocardia yuanmonensis]|uniref:CoA transferase n=1 Tax=Pseudonocardia yuanmonensis TaxID=1095914 RepID=A0ABP8X4Z8_9PSEU
MTSRSQSFDHPLAGLRVLEAGDTLAAAYAGRLLADLGAEVVLLEPPQGHPFRTLGPFAKSVPDAERSASFAYFHAGKRSVTADDAAVRALAARADVLIRSTRDGADWIGDDLVAEIEAARPALVVVDVSTFGRTHRDGPHPTTDLLALAAGGLLSINSTTLRGPDPLPLRYRGELASVHAACGAVLSLLGALVERRRSGLGQRLDVSLQASVASVLATAMSRYHYTGELPVRQGNRSVGPWGFYPCRDGTVLMQITRDEEFRRLVTMLGDPDWGSLEIFETTAGRDENADVLDVFVGEHLAEFTLAEFLELAHTHRIAAAPIHGARDILEWDHLAARGSLPPAALGGAPGESLPVPGRPWRVNGTAPPPRDPAPARGEADAAGLWSGPTAHPAGSGTPAERPLEGVRVIDLTWVWAGPFAAMQLAHLGADVVRVETGTRLETTRGLGPYADGIVGVDRSGYFNQYNQGKRGVALNLKTARGMELLRGLIATADVVIDNMSAGALARMGLPYETLKEINPRIVAVSMTGFGESGPYRDRTAYGSLIDALSGIASSNGDVRGGPTDLVMSLPDPMAGITTAIATVAALYQARASGEGVRVETAMFEACLAAFPWPVLFAGATGGEVPVIGNRDELACPHGTFRCAGDDEWVAIACEDDDRFAALAVVLGAPELADDPRFATLAARRVHEDELEALVTAWTSQRTAAEAAGALQAKGVGAEAVARVDEVYRSPVLAARGFFPETVHAVIGPRRLPSVGWVASRSAMGPQGAAPALGQHTREVLTEILGLSAAELDALEKEGVTV